MELLYILLVLLVATRLFGEVAVRLGQPALVGELVAGICLGALARAWPGTFPILAGLEHNEVFGGIADLGVFFLMLMAGLEMRPRDVREASGKSLFIAVSGLVVPMAAGFGLAWAFLPDSEFRVAQAGFVGTALAITAVPVAVRVLMDLGQLDTPAGKTVVSAALFDDILSLMVLAVLVALIQTGGLPDPTGLALLGARVALFFVVTVALGQYAIPHLGRLLTRFRSDELEFSVLVAVALGFSVLAELLDLHFILGAFIAGLFFERRTLDREAFAAVKDRVTGITTGFLAPIFFASIGLHLRVDALTTIPVFLGLLVVVAMASKLVGAGVPAYLAGLPPRAALGIGVAMSARGAVELIIADIALRGGLFDVPTPVPPVVEGLFSAIVIVAIATTLLVPIVLRLLVPLPPGDT